VSLETTGRLGITQLIRPEEHKLHLALAMSLLQRSACSPLAVAGKRRIARHKRQCGRGRPPSRRVDEAGASSAGKKPDHER